MWERREKKLHIILSEGHLLAMWLMLPLPQGPEGSAVSQALIQVTLSHGWFRSTILKTRQSSGFLSPTIVGGTAEVLSGVVGRLLSAVISDKHDVQVIGCSERIARDQKWHSTPKSTICLLYHLQIA